MKIQLLKRIGVGILTSAHQVTELSIPYISVCVLCPKWLLSPGHLFHRHKSHFEDTALCSPSNTLSGVSLRVLKFVCIACLKKKVAQVAGRQSKPLSGISALLYVARRQWQAVGTHPKRKRMGAKRVMVPVRIGGELWLLVLSIGAWAVAQAMDA